MPGTEYYILAVKRASASTWFHFPPLEREVIVSKIVRAEYVSIPFGTSEKIEYGCEGYSINCKGDYYFPDEEAGLVFQHAANDVLFDLDGTGEELDVCTGKSSNGLNTEVFRKCRVDSPLEFSGGKSLRWKHFGVSFKSRDPGRYQSAAIGGAPGPSPFEVWTGRGQTVSPFSDGT